MLLLHTCLVFPGEEDDAEEAAVEKEEADQQAEEGGTEDGSHGDGVDERRCE